MKLWARVFVSEVKPGVRDAVEGVMVDSAAPSPPIRQRKSQATLSIPLKTAGKRLST